MPTSIAKLTFNPFQENTYVLYDETGECAIIDPGCYEPHEKIELADFISQHQLRPVRLLNTHCHIDHVFGNKFVSETYGLQLEIHRGELPVLEAVPQVSAFYGIPMGDPSPMPGRFIEEGEIISFGNTQLKALYTPGHSPASLSFYCEKGGFVIAGDVLFKESIGRTDLPGGDFDTLIKSIRKQLLPLGDETNVHPGHGLSTTIGYERKFNPFL
jgi:glyoxylase-like metal-dependent hydrolase (beta-lactamase superfamily II)